MFFFFTPWLADLARARSWQDLADNLTRFIEENGQEPGFRRGELIAEVAKVRGEKPRNIALLVQAWSFLRSAYPAKAKPDLVKCGFTNVIEAAKIHELDPQECDKIIDQILQDKFRHAELRALYKQIKERHPARAVGKRAKSDAQSEHVAFVKMLGDVLARNPAFFILGEGLENISIRRGESVGPLNIEFILHGSNNTRVAVEAKAYLPTATQTQRINALGRCALIRPFVGAYFFVAPERYRDGLTELKKAAVELDLDCQFVALDEHSGKLSTL